MLFGWKMCFVNANIIVFSIAIESLPCELISHYGIRQRGKSFAHAPLKTVIAFAVVENGGMMGGDEKKVSQYYMTRDVDSLPLSKRYRIRYPSSAHSFIIPTYILKLLREITQFCMYGHVICNRTYNYSQSQNYLSRHFRFSQHYLSRHFRFQFRFQFTSIIAS